MLITLNVSEIQKWNVVYLISPNDKYNNVRQYIREVLDGKQTNSDVNDVYNQIVDLIKKTVEDIKNEII